MATTSTTVGPYDEGSGAPLNRTHTVIALGYVAPLCWPSCPNELKGIVSFTYPD